MKETEERYETLGRVACSASQKHDHERYKSLCAEGTRWMKDEETDEDKLKARRAFLKGYQSEAKRKISRFTHY